MPTKKMASGGMNGLQRRQAADAAAAKAKAVADAANARREALATRLADRAKETQAHNAQQQQNRAKSAATQQAQRDKNAARKQADAAYLATRNTALNAARAARSAVPVSRISTPAPVMPSNLTMPAASPSSPVTAAAPATNRFTFAPNYDSMNVLQNQMPAQSEKTNLLGADSSTASLYGQNPLDIQPKTFSFKKGGNVKKYAGGGKTSSVSKRGDGIAQRGKTKGRFV